MWYQGFKFIKKGFEKNTDISDHLMSVENDIVHAHRHCENIIGTNLICGVPMNICPVLALNAIIVQKLTV